MKKTALQEAIEKINSTHINAKPFVIDILTKLLEKEKQDLIEAFRSGYEESKREDLDMDEYSDFEDYYKQNFQQ